MFILCGGSKVCSSSEIVHVCNFVHASNVAASITCLRTYSAYPFFAARRQKKARFQSEKDTGRVDSKKGDALTTRETEFDILPDRS